MAGPLLETKLHVPRRRRGQVARPRLGERLSRAGEATLTLVSAPAGFGKTTLLTQWLADWQAGGPAGGRAVAWLALDERDNDPAVFWPYLVTALRTAVPDAGAGALDLLGSPRPSMDAVFATLLNDLQTVPGDVVLVLDDYHVVSSREVGDGVTFLLEHLPPQVHLVIAGRADPVLPLARLRGRGELVEIRAADLRFTADEAAAYLTSMGLALTAPDVASLEARTEGWIAALQLAALSLQGRDDAAGFIAGFAGDDRYIVDYLLEEVLQRQPDDVRTFLLETSVLNRLTGALCDAVTGRRGGAAMLETLDRGNLFLVPLDDRRHWYRYHHLFGDVLRARLQDEQPDAVPDLHRRASAWCEADGERSEAIDHALAGGDVDRAADLVELAIPALSQGRQDATLRRWVDALPDAVLRVRPVLAVAYAGALTVRGEVKGVEARLQEAERWLGTPAAAQLVVVDDDAFRRLPSLIAMYRAAQALIVGDVAATITHARHVLDLAGPEDHLLRGGAGTLLGIADWTSGDLHAARRRYADGMAVLELAGHDSDVVGCAIALADIQITQGHLREATATYESGLWRAEQAEPQLRGAADMHVGLAELCRERNDLDAALAHLRASEELGEHAGLPQNRYRWRVGMARVRQLEGDLGGALELLQEALPLFTTDFSPNVRPVLAVLARMHLAQGRLDEALGWVRLRGLSADDEPAYLCEFEHVTLARVLLAQDATDPGGRLLADAARLLERLLTAAEEGERTGSAIEILVVLALVRQAQGDLVGALGSLRRAVTLAEPEGYVRVFADEGPPMASLLRALAKERSSAGYVRRLLVATAAAAAVGSTGEPGATGGVGRPGLVDPLSAREREVLRLLATDLDGPEIARRLVVSLNTVRTHTKNIYAKLGVSGRRAAVRRARELDL